MFWPSSKWYVLTKSSSSSSKLGRKFANLMRLVPIDTRFFHSDSSRLFRRAFLQIVDRGRWFLVCRISMSPYCCLYKGSVAAEKSRSAHTRKWHSARRSDRAQDIPQTDACHQIAKCIDKNSFCSLSLIKWQTTRAHTNTSNRGCSRVPTAPNRSIASQ